MNKWKVAFFALLILIIGSIIGIIIWATAPSDELPIPNDINQNETDSVVQVELTSKDFEKVVNKLLKNELGAFQLNITTQVEIVSEIQAFGISVPILMYFDPEVKEDGNIQLKQTSANLGRLNLPSETVLKLMNDSIDFPNWIIIRPDSNVIDLDLSKVEIKDGVKIKAKQIDLKQDKVVLEIIFSDD